MHFFVFLSFIAYCSSVQSMHSLTTHAKQLMSQSVRSYSAKITTRQYFQHEAKRFFSSQQAQSHVRDMPDHMLGSLSYALLGMGAGMAVGMIGEVLADDLPGIKSGQVYVACTKIGTASGALCQQKGTAAWVAIGLGIAATKHIIVDDKK